MDTWESKITVAYKYPSTGVFFFFFLFCCIGLAAFGASTSFLWGPRGVASRGGGWHHIAPTRFVEFLSHEVRSVIIAQSSFLFLVVYHVVVQT